jgi:hypothetical protein
MIHYQLQCDSAHAFDGWFKDSASFDSQADIGLIACPLCNSVKVRRALMSPALGRGSRHAPTIPALDQKDPAPTSPDSMGTPPTIAQPLWGARVEGEMPDRLRTLLHRLRSEVEKHCDYVGPGFAEEARRIHYGETESRSIYGETTPAEAEALVDEGIEFGVMPWLRRSDS